MFLGVQRKKERKKNPGNTCTCVPGVQRKRENPRNTHMRVPGVQRKKEKRRKNPGNTHMRVPRVQKRWWGGRKRVVGAENVCWGSRHVAAVDNAWLGVENAW